ncbi:MAG: VWA domain-containing protein [Chloroflexi bacterium]|nr:VWA domain-containing protein [Chloroflexota bacterium]
MKQRKQFLVGVLMSILAMIACTGDGSSGGGINLGNTVTIEMVYGSEKEDWLVPLVEQYNNQRNQTPEGATIRVEAVPIGSIESANGIIDGTLQPTIWSPASSLYIPVANAEWRAANGEDLVLGDPNDLVLSPVVIAMWRPMAEALGWPEASIGWADIAELATSEEGWAAYGFPEWGCFKLGHTHPEFSNSGITSIIAQTYAGAGLQRDLDVSNVEDPAVRAFVGDVQKSLIHYGRSTGFFARRMFAGGPSYLSAAILYENLIVAQETERLAGRSQQLPVVAIYPEEGTFWSNHPYAILNAPWVTDEQRVAAEMFEAFLLAEPQQQQALQFGFRPADPSIPLGAPLNADHGVDINQPQTVLEVPDADVIVSISQMWREVKKPVDLVVVMDISGSMRGQKIASARTSLIQFIDLLADRDRLEIILFDDDLITLTELSPLGEKRAEVIQRVSGVIEDGDTRLYDAIQLGYDRVETVGDPNHIRALVVLSDGDDTASTLLFEPLLAQVANVSEGGDSTKIFTIAFGANANRDILSRISDSTGARMYEGDPDTINEVYIEISTFF